MARPHGAKNIRPTVEDEKELFWLLKLKAKEGDVNAAGWLLVLKKLIDADRKV